MKPSFALTLSDDEIGLLHRTARGWLEIGQTRFDTPDLTEALGYLRGSANGLSPRGITTKLVIPNSQILYMDLDAPGPDAALRRKQIRAALQGRTPYDVADLVFDWAGSGPTVQVAVVARETLEVAEGFAAEHRFNPLSFVAIPPPGVFGKEPWFGPTSLAPGLLAEGDKVERDQQPVVIVARELPKGEAAVVAEPAVAVAAEAAVAVAVAAEPAAVAEPVVTAAADVVVPPAPVAEHPASPPAPVAAVAEPHPVPEPVTPATAPVVPAPAAMVADPVVSLAPADVAPPPPAMPEPAFTPPPAPARPAPPEPVVVTPAPTPAPSSAPAISAAPVMAPPPVPPPAAAPEAVAAKAARDAIRAERPAPASVLDDPLEPAKAAKAARGTDVPDAPFIDVADPVADDPAAPSFASRRAADATPPPLSVAATTFTAPKAPKPATPVATRPAVPGANRPAGTAVPRPVATGAAVTAPGIPGGRGRKAVKPIVKPSATPAGAQPAASGASTMGGFGARQLPQRGKPRYLGLILTGALLLFLALVAAWSSFYIASRSSDEAALEAAALTQPGAGDQSGDGAETAAISAPEALPVPGIDDEMLADLQDPADFPPDDAAELPAPDVALAGDTPSADGVAVAGDTLPADGVAVEAETAGNGTASGDGLTTGSLSADVAGNGVPLAGDAPSATSADAADAALPAATETAALPPPSLPASATDSPVVRPLSEAQDEIFLATMDSPLQQLDAVALPQPLAGPDALPAAQLPPPPFGTTYQFDSAGRILPTPDGIVTPEGYTLIAGRPPVVPPARPAAAAALATAALPPATPDPTDPAPVAAAQPAETAVAAPDPALAGARPRSRPEGLVPPPAQAEDDAALPDADATRLTSRRPQVRPATVFAQAEAAREATAAASLVLAAASAPAVTPSSPLALTVSRKPLTRPKDFTRSVEAAVAAAVRQPDPPAAEPEEQPVARSEPEADDEPEVVAAAPRIPTRASVAKQATFTNAINLSKINLIGVYGTSSKRSALVRQANGRYRKVGVGDRVDGGTVAAITASELRYQKGSRMITLAMPKG